MEGANIGPRVTQYTLKPPTGVKLTKITALENNLALDLAAHSIRMEAPIPGKRAVGIEVPNVKAATVRVSSLLQSREWTSAHGKLGFVIGKDIAGNAVVADLAKMPHLLVAGQTGSGKSVMINTFLTSLLYRNSPSDLKLILVDPKQVEMAPYQDIPHLLTPVINEPEKCISALKWAVAEMERRLRTMAEVGKRNIGEYNNLKKEEGMPYIVIVIDELADLMMMAARDVEALIVRLAQKARAAGIHLVLATQRPSVDVITGLIKANVPARIAFTVASQVDSRTIIDQMGAEKLLGRGDMLLLTSDMPKPKRVQAALIEDDETAKVMDFIKMQRPPQYDDEVVSQPVQLNGKGGVVADFGGSDPDDDMFRDAVKVVIENRKASTSLLQRRLRIGYGRAARIMEQMEEQGIIGHADGSRPRDVLVSSVDEVFGGGAAGEVDDFEPAESDREAYLNQ
jgi:S-DNA-T family DNA segregation ATPase FtsK/SpoIIIE